ncbi:hypothetical protein GCM10007423_11680 [Dyadobacter endophyticus]|uniref:Uncharacterized protein n=1 Tax=Dyadobacter endophyticus TaxID=1749036 RepID=A0ABQ1YJ48_9BACT|nr:hypothetical protein GCM10007423_11680 [Dyadobacter endophyticus]
MSFSVNGNAVNLEMDARTTLLDTLREHLHLTGAKRLCESEYALLEPYLQIFIKGHVSIIGIKC